MQAFAAACAAAAGTLLLRVRVGRKAAAKAAQVKAFAARAVPRPDAECFRVVTYNVLADGPWYCLNPNAKYSVGKWHLTADRRFPALVREVTGYKPDILALQEVQDHSMKQYFTPGFSKDMPAQHVNDRVFFQHRASGDKANQMLKSKDATFYNTAVWEVLAKDMVPFDSMLDAWLLEARLFTDSRKLLEAGAPEYADPGRNVSELYRAMRKRYDGVLMSLLRHRPSGRLLVFGQSHLYYNPVAPQVKAMQGFFMARAVADFARQQGCVVPGPDGAAATSDTAGKPAAEVILAGDLNSLPHRPSPNPTFDLPQTQEEWDAAAASDPYAATSGVVTLWSSGRLPATHQEHPARRGAAGVPDLVSAVGPLTSATVAASGQEAPFTTRTLTFEGTLDYIFISSGLEVRGMLPLPFDADGLTPDGTPFQAVPNTTWPSDHLAIGADIAFKQAPGAAAP